MTQQTFTFDYNARDYAASSTNSNRTATPNQVRKYLELCEQKGLPAENYAAWSIEYMSDKISDLYRFKPASEKQIALIKEKITNLQEAGVLINMPSEKTLHLLTGGLGGTASELLDQLIKQEAALGLSAKIPATDNQVSAIVKMFLFPDADFESFGVSRKIQIDETHWRYCTPDEFAIMIQSSFSKQDASKFIETNRAAFYEWTSTRIRPEQIRHIRDLEKRMQSLHNQVTVEWVVDIEGNLTRQESVKPQHEWLPDAYMPMEDMQLQMMSKEDANTYINMLSKDLKDKSLTKFGERSDSSMTFEALRKSQTIEQVKKEEFRNIQDVLFKLEAVAGYHNDEVHDCITSLMLEPELKNDEHIKIANQKLKDFMVFLIEEDYITLESMVELIGDSELAKSVLIK
ncbi:hypothetical protein A7K50_03170 [Dehalobacter sp. MCB1]|uniref:hypothetical protein n=1 Tax=Dehalobacter sp. MCB1 TaxID=1844756 RepID=UPI000E6C67C1|nr:hypothetical protein [Dehalobacter sp. MCB1]RJE47662.1 hypothetical protein A7K50_03170 [Dehalobacter sp. MCB1]